MAVCDLALPPTTLKGESAAQAPPTWSWRRCESKEVVNALTPIARGSIFWLDWRWATLEYLSQRRVFSLPRRPSQLARLGANRR